MKDKYGYEIPIDELREEWAATVARVRPLLSRLTKKDRDTLRLSAEEGYEYLHMGCDAPHEWDWYSDLADQVVNILWKLGIESSVEHGEWFVVPLVCDPEGECIERDILALLGEPR